MSDYSGIVAIAKAQARNEMACELVLAITTLAASCPGGTYTRACIDINRLIAAAISERQAMPNVGENTSRAQNIQEDVGTHPLLESPHDHISPSHR